MKSRRSKVPAKAPNNQRRPEMPTLAEVFSVANRQAHERANRRSGKRGLRSVRAAITATAPMDEDAVEWPRRMMRWMMGLVLLPMCWVTAWTFFSRFSMMTVERGFWQTAEFWYFALGALSMIGWFWSGLLQKFFLYIYVLGHELTHALFVILCRGRVSQIHVSASGGYITTNKTNLIIALSPYFLPFWSVVCAVAFAVMKLTMELAPVWDLVFYAAMGVTWTFHMVWTLWMIPRDQPDLRQNGTFLSLCVIFLSNLLVLVALLCLASDTPLQDAREFAFEWIKHFATSADVAWRRVQWLVREGVAAWSF